MHVQALREKGNYHCGTSPSAGPKTRQSHYSGPTIEGSSDSLSHDFLLLTECTRHLGVLIDTEKMPCSQREGLAAAPPGGILLSQYLAGWSHCSSCLQFSVSQRDTT